jgi:hypothetical protein
MAKLLFFWCLTTFFFSIRKKFYWSLEKFWIMRNYIFSDRDRRILEAHLIKAEVDKLALSKLLRRIKNEKVLFEDVFLYLQVRKKLTS